MKRTVLFGGFALWVLCAVAQQREMVLKYIEQYKDIAIEEMVRAKVPASITLAQGILETAAGTSTLCLKSNNHFGIKCKEDWTGGKYYHNDDKPNECFRVYNSARESYRDHSDFLASRKWYAPLFQLPITSYKYWAYGLKEAGYATNPQYAQLLIKYIEDYKLYEYDQIGLAKIEEQEKLLAASKDAAATEKPLAQAEELKKAHPAQERKKNTSAGRQEYVVNGLRAVKANGVEDPLTIAFAYDIDYSWILTYNDMAPGEKFKDGQYIFLQNKKMRGAEQSVTVQPGESMYDVSQRTGIKLRQLYYINAMRPNDQAYPGEVLSLQEKRTSPPRTMSYAEFLKKYSQYQSGTVQGASGTELSPAISGEYSPTGGRRYQVQPTDTLHDIANRFQVTVEQLKEWNGLRTNELREGQTLVVSQ
ncbi:MAG: glucosaminidase domain-containing protein [Chitinophagales bacterium]|nr:glucosaminidase domain-containing protein [Chitinophagales bacterium]MDW8419896.1 glucosaminidase domain-containing protein [Chitinophagales bacterium]